jgi:hypothetical protein
MVEGRIIIGKIVVLFGSQQDAVRTLGSITENTGKEKRT